MFNHAHLQRVINLKFCKTLLNSTDQLSRIDSSPHDIACMGKLKILYVLGNIEIKLSCIYSQQGIIASMKCNYIF